MPRSRSTALKRSLSMQSADAATPAPTYGTFASSSRPWTVPSSPNGPCRTGRTTSTEPIAAAGFESASTGSFSCYRNTFSLEHALLARPSERPAAVAADRDRRRLVPLRIERLEHRAGRGERDLVLAGAPAGDDGDPDAPGHGVGVVAVVGGGAAPARSGRRRSPPSCPARRRCRPPGPARARVPSRRLVVDDLLDHLHLEAGLLQLRTGVRLGLARDVRDLGGLRALRTPGA